jgi:hypothetical protein
MKPPDGIVYNPFGGPLIILFVPFNHFNDFQIGGNIMGKYLVLWEIDQTKIPIDPKERGDGWGFLMAMVRQDIEKGLTKDWGAFVGETSGYAVNEGTELEVMKGLQQYVPFCIFKVHPIATETQVNEMTKALSG